MGECGGRKYYQQQVILTSVIPKGQEGPKVEVYAKRRFENNGLTWNQYMLDSLVGRSSC